MENKSRIAEEYFKNCKYPELNEFLDYSCKQMFNSYLLKYLRETKKRYMNRKRILKSFETDLTEYEYADLVCETDNYNCFFEELIDNLPEKQKLIIILCFKFGYKDTAAAKIAGVSPQAAYGLKQRALKNIRKKL